MKFSKVVKEGKEYIGEGIVGRLTKDPQIMEGREGKKDVAYLRIANNEYKDTEFVEVRVFDKSVKACHLIGKGCWVAVSGQFVAGKDSENNDITVLNGNKIEIITYKEKTTQG